MCRTAASDAQLFVAVATAQSILQPGFYNCSYEPVMKMSCINIEIPRWERPSHASYVTLNPSNSTGTIQGRAMSDPVDHQCSVQLWN